MVRLLVLYNKPNDAEAFHKHFDEVVAPLAKKMPGVRRYTVSRDVMPSQSGEPYYMVAEIDWDDMESLKRDFESPEGKAAAVEAAKVSEMSPGTRSMIYEFVEV